MRFSVADKCLERQHFKKDSNSKVGKVRILLYDFAIANKEDSDKNRYPATNILSKATTVTITTQSRVRLYDGSLHSLQWQEVLSHTKVPDSKSGARRTLHVCLCSPFQGRTSLEAPISSFKQRELSHMEHFAYELTPVYRRVLNLTCSLILCWLERCTFKWRVYTVKKLSTNFVV